MSIIWINAVGGSPSNAVNMRKSPSTSSEIVGKLSTLGVLAQVTGTSNQSDGVWYKFNFRDSKQAWIRNDVIDGVHLGYSPIQTRYPVIPLKRILDVKFHSQNDRDSNMSYNDCGPASSTMMLEHAGKSVTVNDFMVTAGINHGGFTNFNDNIRGIARYGETSEARIGTRISDILYEVGYMGNPVFSLVYYHHLNAGKRYGHFLVPLGYEIKNGTLYIVAHDPNRIAYMRFTASDFSNAIGYVGGSGNMPYQSLFVTSYDKNPPPVIVSPEPEPTPEPVPEPEPTPEPVPEPDDPSDGTDGTDGFDYQKAVIDRLNILIRLQQETLLEMKEINRNLSGGS